MRRLLLLLLVALALPLAGCGPTFDSPAEELAYLQALSNPTPAQWKRRQALEQDAERARIERDAEQFMERQRELAREIPAKVAALLDRARDMESASTLGAIGAYEEIIKLYPDRPEARTAEERIRVLEAQRRAEDGG
jgi:hypothetical protein